jgi:hypothetical protein
MLGCSFSLNWRHGMNYPTMKSGIDRLKSEHKGTTCLIPLFLQKWNKWLWMWTKLIEQIRIAFEHVVKTVECTLFRKGDHWSKGDGINPFILPSVGIFSDLEVYQLSNLPHICKSPRHSISDFVKSGFAQSVGWNRDFMQPGEYRRPGAPKWVFPSNIASFYGRGRDYKKYRKNWFAGEVVGSISGVPCNWSVKNAIFLIWASEIHWIGANVFTKLVNLVWFMPKHTRTSRCCFHCRD